MQTITDDNNGIQLYTIYHSMLCYPVSICSLFAEVGSPCSSKIAECVCLTLCDCARSMSTVKYSLQSDLCVRAINVFFAYVYI